MQMRNGIITVLLAGAISPLLLLHAQDAKTAKPTPNPVDVYIERARTQDAQGRHDLAANNWRQVLLLSPRQPEALKALVRYYSEQGDSANEKVYLNRLRAVEPQSVELKRDTPATNAQATLDEAAKLSRQHRYREALDLYRKVLGSNPTSGDWAVAYYETEAAIPGEEAHAVQSLRNIVAAYPANPAYALSLAKVLTYNPASRAEGLRMLADLHGSPQTNEQARSAWREALLWDPASTAAQESGAVYLERYADADLSARLRTAKEARIHAESLGTPEEAEAYASLQSGDFAAASKQFSELLKQPGQSARAHVGLAYVAMKERDFEAAVTNFEQARSEGLRSQAADAAYHDARYWLLMQRGNKAADSGNEDNAAASFEDAVKLDPTRPEGTEALAGLWLKKQQPDKALDLLNDDVRAHSEREAAWLMLTDAEIQASEFKQVVAQQKIIPSAVQEKLSQDPNYLAALASAHLSLGDDADAQSTLQQLDAVSSSDAATRAKVDLKLAELMLRQDRVEDALKLSRTAVRADRSNPESWRTLIRAEDQAGRDGTAQQLIDNLPGPVKDKLMQDPGFLIQAASIFQKQHEYDGAALMLQRAQNLGAQDLQTSIPLQLQLASLDLEMGRTPRAYEIYRQLTREVPDRAEPWIGLLSAMHAASHDAEALESAQAIPADLRFALRKDTGYLQIMASIYSATGDDTRAMECLKRVTQHYREQEVAVPFAVNLQYAWLQLNAGNEAGLSASLDSLAKSPDLSPAHKKQMEDLWVAWAIRRAEKAQKTGHADLAFSLLNTAITVYPDNADLRHEIGTLYIQRGQPEQAYRLYDQFDWEGASAADFSGGMAAAAASNHWKQAELWLRMALNQYPGNRQLLTQAAQMEQDHGDLKKAEAYWASLRSLDDPAADPSTLTADRPSNARAGSAVNQLAAMLMSTPHMRTPAAPRGRTADLLEDDGSDDLLTSPHKRSNDSAPEEELNLAPSVAPASAPSDGIVVRPIKTSVNTRTPGLNEMAVEMRGESENGGATRGRLSSGGIYGQEDRANSQPHFRVVSTSPNDAETGEESGSNTASSEPSAGEQPSSGATYRSGSTGVHPFMFEASQRPNDDGLAVLRSQMSPWLGGGALANSRSGSAGFDQLTRIESSMETSTVLAQSLRLSAILRPVLLEAGQASSTPLYGWGTSGTAPYGDQYASGVGGEVQLASAHVLASLGYTPTSFAVHNTVGSFTFSPTHSFSVHFSREPVKDTLLSYAGSVDTKTGQVWGGVVASGAGLQINHGDSRSGFYALLDYASLTGRNVTSNDRVSGSMGGYWKGYRNDNGELTFGINMTGLHYDKNLQYFTFGQGGYFSPDVYMLINAPITWQSTPIENFSYIVSGSIGTQSYQQGAVMPGSLLTDVYSTPGASANYALDVRGSYRITPNWYLEAFLAANNTYDYQQRIAGFSLKYMMRPHPASVTAMPTGLFDVNAIRPLLIP